MGFFVLNSWNPIFSLGAVLQSRPIYRLTTEWWCYAFPTKFTDFRIYEIIKKFLLTNWIYMSNEMRQFPPSFTVLLMNGRWHNRKIDLYQMPSSAQGFCNWDEVQLWLNWLSLVSFTNSNVMSFEMLPVNTKNFITNSMFLQFYSV